MSQGVGGNVYPHLKKTNKPKPKNLWGMLRWDFIALALHSTCTSVSGNSLGIVWMGCSGRYKAVYILDISVKTKLHKYQQESPAGVNKSFRRAVFMWALIQWKAKVCRCCQGLKDRKSGPEFRGRQQMWHQSALKVLLPHYSLKTARAP